MKNVVLALASAVLLSFMAVLLIFFYSSPQSNTIQVEKTPLENAILEDARQRFPDADIVEIANVEERDGNKVIAVRVTSDYSSTCPQRKHLYYTYPEGRFLPDYPVNVITSCNLCSEGGCLVVYEEEAIIASLNIPGTEEVRDFVVSQGATPLPKKIGDLWSVKWVGKDSAYEVVFTKDGQLMEVSLINRTTQ